MEGGVGDALAVIRCTADLCHRSGFLPFRCVKCGLPFCEKHHLPERHGCTAWENDEDIRVLICPKCNLPVSESSLTFEATKDSELVDLNDDITQVQSQLRDLVNERLARNSHLRGVSGYDLPGLKDEESEDVLFVSIRPELSKRLRALGKKKSETLLRVHMESGCQRRAAAPKEACGLPSCTEAGLKIVCKSCMMMFCLKHRLPEVHQCRHTSAAASSAGATSAGENAASSYLSSSSSSLSEQSSGSDVGVIPLKLIPTSKLSQNPSIISAITWLLSREQENVVPLQRLETVFEKETGRTFYAVRKEGLLQFLEQCSTLFRVFSLPETPGLHVARAADVLEIDATFLRPNKLPVVKRTHMIRCGPFFAGYTLQILKKTLFLVLKGEIPSEATAEQLAILHFQNAEGKEPKKVPKITAEMIQTPNSSVSLVANDAQVEALFRDIKLEKGSDGILRVPKLQISVVHVPFLPPNAEAEMQRLKQIEEEENAKKKRAQESPAIQSSFPRGGGIRVTGIDVPATANDGILRLFVAIARESLDAPDFVIMCLRNITPNGENRAAFIARPLPDLEPAVAGIEVPLVEIGQHIIEIHFEAQNGDEKIELFRLDPRYIQVR